MSGAILSVHSEYHPLLMGSQSRQMTKKALRRISRIFFCAKIATRPPTFCRKTLLHRALSVIFIAKSADLSAC
ncbi:hypothetical protein AB0305_03805 [Arthrobacter sp. NPDC080086]|uniref:hypothetical protein n=1 Tax=Arthrobacter sp. NPDC080086 TaxID=3155917 RepID=UPI00344DA558